MRATLSPLAVIILATACGTFSSPGGSTPTTDTAAGDAAGDSVATDTVAKADTATAGDAAKVDTPTRNPKCDKFDDGTYGKKVPWKGFTHKGRTYTCNACRGGYPNLIGSWRLVDFKTEDPSVDLGGDKERLTFDGNVFEMRMYGDDQGKKVDVTATGWFFCADGVELTNQRSIFIFDKVVPEGGMGWNSGHVTSAELLVQGTNQLAFGFNDDFDAKLPGHFVYCRVGSMIKGKPCDNPFK